MRRQRKPYVTEKRGRLYYRMRGAKDENGKRPEKWIPLPGEEDSEEFDRKYWSIRSGTAPELKRAPKTSWEALIRSYRASQKYRRLAPSTRRVYDFVLDQLREKNGSRDVRKVTRSDIRAIHEKYADRPRKADHNLQVIRILLNFAMIELEWIEKNPAVGIELFGAQKEFGPWPEDAQTAYANAAEERTVARIFFELGVGTGQRAGDLVKMEWSHYDGEGIEVLQEKTNERLWVPAPARLRAYLDSLPVQGKFILTKNLTEPWPYNYCYNRFRETRAKISEKWRHLVPHGWRATASVELAEAGATEAELMAVLGHKSFAMAAKYRRRANQKTLARAAQKRRE